MTIGKSKRLLLVAAAIVLLVTVGLFLKALWQVQAIDPGFDPRGVVTARTTLRRASVLRHDRGNRGTVRIPEPRPDRSSPARGGRSGERG